MKTFLLFFLFAMVLAAPVRADVVNNGATTQITAASKCRWITNNHASGKALFAPTGVGSDWTRFFSYLPSGVTASYCTTCNMTLYSACTNPDGVNPIMSTQPNYATCETWCNANGAAANGWCCMWYGPSYSNACYIWPTTAPTVATGGAFPGYAGRCNYVNP